jgi:hypothetical protein
VIVQKIRPSIRLLCLGVGVLLLTMLIASWRAGNGARDIGGMGLFAALFLFLGTAGSLEDADDPPGSERFHELADPARSLLPEDLRRPDERVREPEARGRARPE